MFASYNACGFSLRCGVLLMLRGLYMKIATTLMLLCTEVIIGGCSTDRGGPSDESNAVTGTGTATEPGGVATPPDMFPNTGPAFPPP